MPLIYFERCTENDETNFASGSKTSYNEFLITRSIVLLTALISSSLIFYRSWANCPRIVIRLWLLIDAAAVLSLLDEVFWSYDDGFYNQKFSDQVLCFAALICVTAFHYLFSIEYLKAALKLPIMMAVFDTQDFEYCMEKANSTVNLLNLIFCVMSALVIVLQVCLLTVMQSAIIFICGTVLLQIFAAIVLIVSILSLRRFIKNSKMHEFIMNERLMIIHTGLYCSFIATYSIMTVARYIFFLVHNSQEDRAKLECRTDKIAVASNFLLFLSDLGMLILQAFMSSKFSAPVSNSRRKFMLVYQAQRH